jgi:tetratricopeptide (TPR) repeat protein
LVQMPALIAREERERLQKELFGATRQRMMREMTDGLDALSAETPFVLALEDLHWCDPSTVDLITSLARRVNPARFMLLGTYRPVEIALSRHPLREVTQDLLSRRLCHNVALDCLSEASIEEYLTARFKVADLLADRATLARRLHRHTGGNPLFLVNLVDYLEARDALNMPDVQIGLPETLRQMITRQVERLKETDQRMIEAGAVAGADFDAAAVATAVGITSDLVEECCDELVAKGMFLKKAEHPGGVRSRSLARYSFIHALYRECLYERIQASRRQRWHQAIGEWQEAGGMDPAELASELAVHFEASGDLHRAIHYLKLAAAGAAARFAFVEGRQCLDRAAKLVQSLPAPERGMLELELFDQRRMFRAAGAITPDQSEMFEAMAGKARDLGRPDLEIKLLVEAGEMLLWLDRHHMCEVLDRARELSTVIDDPLLRATAQAVRAMWRLYLFGEPRGLLDEFLEAMAVIEASKNPSLVAQFKWKYSALLLEDSQYEAAYQVAAEGAEVSKVAGQMYDYLASHYGIHWSLMHQGRWGEGLALLRDCCELCLKNDAREPVALFQAQRALFSIEMLDFEGAFAIARPLWEQLKDLPGHTFGHMLGAIVLAHSLTGLGDFQESTKIFQEFLERVQRDRFILEPRMQKYLWTGLANNWFIQGNFDEARQATARVLPLCRELRDRTFLTQCHNLLAEIDEVEGKRQDARQHISEALKILDSEGPCILPAARRVYRSASRLLDDGPGFRERAEGVIEALGASLLDHPQLQRKFVDRARSCGNATGGGA